jgi:hypothetical protein
MGLESMATPQDSLELKIYLMSSRCSLFFCNYFKIKAII